MHGMSFMEVFDGSVEAAGTAASQQVAAKSNAINETPLSRQPASRVVEWFR